jgi:hypothetical protein
MIQQTKQEKIKTFYQAKNKADNDLILYYHFQTVKKNWYNKIKKG